jgi:hypothetical protein
MFLITTYIDLITVYLYALYINFIVFYFMLTEFMYSSLYFIDKLLMLWI